MQLMNESAVKDVKVCLHKPGEPLTWDAVVGSQSLNIERLTLESKLARGQLKYWGDLTYIRSRTCFSGKQMTAMYSRRTSARFDPARVLPS